MNKTILKGLCVLSLFGISITLTSCATETSLEVVVTADRTKSFMVNGDYEQLHGGTLNLTSYYIYVTVEVSGEFAIFDNQKNVEFKSFVTNSNGKIYDSYPDTSYFRTFSEEDITFDVGSNQGANNQYSTTIKCDGDRPWSKSYYIYFSEKGVYDSATKEYSVSDVPTSVPIYLQWHQSSIGNYNVSPIFESNQTMYSFFKS